MEKINIREKLYPIIVSILPVLGVSLYLNAMQDWEMNTFLISFAIVCLLVIIHIFYLLRKQPVSYLIFSITLLLIAVVIISKREFILGDGEDITKLIRIGVIVLASIVSYICAGILIAKEVISAGLLIFLVFAGGYELEGVRIGIAAIVTYCILSLSEYCIAVSLRKRKMENKKVFSAMLPIYVVLFIAIAVSPAQSECFKWRMLRNTVSVVQKTAFNVYDHFKGKGNNEYGEYQVAMTGYSESGAIGEGVINGDGMALTVESEEEQSRSIYLIGNYKNKLEGSQWKDTRSKETYNVGISDQRLDTMELLYALERYNSFQDYNTYLALNKLRIMYTGIRTKTLFRLAKTDSILFDGEAPEREEGALEQQFTRLAGNGTTYDVSYYALNYGGNKFSDFIKNSEGYVYEPSRKINITIKNGQYLVLDRNLEQQLAERKNYIYSNYLEVGDDIPKRVGMLAKEITKNCTTEYDQLIALEKYLHTYSYTMNPKHLPEGREVVDYFLFDSKEGYCTYFASAMAIMARTLGIPTRYVQGYLIGASAKKWTSYQVADRDAHAWVEAYIDGVGWIAFEPTAGYMSEQYSPWTVDHDGNVQSHVMDKGEKKINSKGESGGTLKAVSYLKRMGLVCAVLILCIITVIAARILLNQYLYKKASNRQKVYYEVMRLEGMLKVLGIVRNESDTWIGFMNKIQNRLPIKKGNEVNEIFSRMRYRGDEPNENEVTVFCGLNGQLLSLIRERHGKWVYYRILLNYKLQPVRFKKVE